MSYGSKVTGVYVSGKFGYSHLTVSSDDTFSRRKCQKEVNSFLTIPVAAVSDVILFHSKDFKPRRVFGQGYFKLSGREIDAGCGNDFWTVSDEDVGS